MRRRLHDRPCRRCSPPSPRLPRRRPRPRPRRRRRPAFAAAPADRQVRRARRAGRALDAAGRRRGARGGRGAARQPARSTTRPPNYIATASATSGAAIPNDPGTAHRAAGRARRLGRQAVELPALGRLRRPPLAADLARRDRRDRRLGKPGQRSGAPGRRGVTVAVLDTGIAYRSARQPLPPQPRLRRRPVRQGL